MAKNEGTCREIPYQDFVSGVFVATEVVTNIDSESISPDFPDLDRGKQRGEASAPPSYECRWRFNGHHFEWTGSFVIIENRMMLMVLSFPSPLKQAAFISFRR